MTDNEFKALMTMQKHIDDAKIELPLIGETGKTITVFSDTTSDVFVIDSDRKSRISLIKKKLQKKIWKRL